MITEDPQLETRLRHYGTIIRNDIQVTPALHASFSPHLLLACSNRPVCDRRGYEPRE